jgi:hypothetical protein
MFREGWRCLAGRNVIHSDAILISQLKGLTKFLLVFGQEMRIVAITNVANREERIFPKPENGAPAKARPFFFTPPPSLSVYGSGGFAGYLHSRVDRVIKRPNSGLRRLYR